MKAKQYPPRKSQTISPYKLFQQENAGAHGGLTCGNDEDRDSGSPTIISYTNELPDVHRLPRMQPPTEAELINQGRKSVVDHYSTHCNDTVFGVGDRTKSNYFDAQPQTNRHDQNRLSSISRDSPTSRYSSTLRDISIPEKPHIRYSPSEQAEDKRSPYNSSEWRPSEHTFSTINIIRDHEVPNKLYADDDHKQTEVRSSRSSVVIEDPGPSIPSSSYGRYSGNFDRYDYTPNSCQCVIPIQSASITESGYQGEDEYLQRYQVDQNSYRVDQNKSEYRDLSDQSPRPTSSFRVVSFKPEEGDCDDQFPGHSSIQRIIAKPVKLHRENVAKEKIISRLKEFSAQEREISPPTPPPTAMEERFIDKMRSGLSSENRAILKSSNSGKLDGYIGGIELHLIEYSIIPGGPLLAVVYLSVLQPVILTQLTLTVEEFSRFESTKRKNNYENRNSLYFECLSSNTGVDRREPPHLFGFDLPEFSQPLDSLAKLNSLCYLPYCGPVIFRRGHFAIPCIAAMDSTTHPSFVLTQRTNNSPTMELTHGFKLSALLHMKREDDRSIVTLETEHTPIRVLSCGPLPKTLPNGNLIPSVSRAIPSADTMLLLQIDSLTILEGGTVNVYLLTDKPDYVKNVEIIFLQVLHIPVMDIDDHKSLNKVRKFPANVTVIHQASSNRMVTIDPLPFSQAAESACSRQSLGATQANLVCISSEEEDPSRPMCGSTELLHELPRVDRRGGCHFSVKVPVGAIPTLCLDTARVSYYLRMLIRVKRKVTTCTIPITVVAAQCEDYDIKYLTGASYLQDRAEFKQAKSSRCSVS